MERGVVVFLFDLEPGLDLGRALDIGLDVHALLAFGDVDTVTMTLLDINRVLLVAGEDANEMNSIVVLGHHLELWHDGHNLAGAKVLLKVLVFLKGQ